MSDLRLQPDDVVGRSLKRCREAGALQVPQGDPSDHSVRLQSSGLLLKNARGIYCSHLELGTGTDRRMYFVSLAYPQLLAATASFLME